MSSALLIAGIVAMLRSGVVPQHVSFGELRTVPSGLAGLDGSALIHAGIVLLLLTPVARVAALLVEYAARRERLFAMVSFGILLLLAASLVLGLR